MEMRAWTQEMSVGFEELDRQHKQLFVYLNEMINLSGGISEALGALNRFGDAMFDHFAGEERFMAAMGYSELNFHRVRHLSFARQFAKVLMNIQNQEARPLAMMQAHQVLGDWLADEIRDVDVQLGHFLAQNIELQPAAR
jgi:hemerythrin-like metal-binding protein